MPSLGADHTPERKALPCRSDLRDPPKSMLDEGHRSHPQIEGHLRSIPRRASLAASCPP
ncbi:hypothetical protein [Pseudomonas sp. UBA6562]|uniref:hypothetical protein n=1 Tax=Pseudomonas sp. UBA6562 TaxID=1947332 RepID=UPI0025F7A030|nr:hypothetical protein [Pseudomonas sp. UBA6562]